MNRCASTPIQDRSHEPVRVHTNPREPAHTNLQASMRYTQAYAHTAPLPPRTHTQLPYYCVSAFVFGAADSDCAAKLRSAAAAKGLLSLTSDDWVAALRAYYLARPFVCVRAAPSAARAAALAEVRPPEPSGGFTLVDARPRSTATVAVARNAPQRAQLLAMRRNSRSCPR
jgi:hypothetical protein